jgi:serine/threonine-protein kinase RsbW
MTRPKVRFCLVFERELLSVPVMRQVLGDTLRGIGVHEDSVDDILLAATEACTNVVLHAGQSAPAYTVAATVDSVACRLEVTDAGQGCSRTGRERVRRGSAEHAGGAHGAGDHAMTDHAMADHAMADHGAAGKSTTGDQGTVDYANLAESGRGFAIMQACVDAVTLRSAPGQGTRVVLDKRIAWEAPLSQTA